MSTPRSSLEWNSMAELLDNMREWLVRSGDLRFLDSPEEEIYSFASPLVLSAKSHSQVVQALEEICTALEHLGARLAGDRALARGVLRFSSPLEEEFFFHGPGFGPRLPIRRLDMALGAQGNPLLLEVNCGCPGGELDPALVAEAYSQALGKGREPGFLFLDPREESLSTLMECYEEFRKGHPLLPEMPTLALITCQAQARFMLPECRGIAAHYRSRGVRALVGRLSELRLRGDELALGDEPVHLIFRKFSTESFRRRLEKPDNYGQEALGSRSLWEAVLEGRVCLVNPLGSTLLQDKALLGILRQEFPQLSTYIPETVLLSRDLVRLEPDLWKAICTGEPFVLKRRLSYGGRHVILDPRRIRQEAPRLLREEPGAWVAQSRVGLGEQEFWIWEPGGIRHGRFPFVLSPFGRSAFVRVGLDPKTTRPINAHGGSATSFVLVRPD